MIVQGLIRQVLGFLERDGKTLSTGRDVRAEEALRIVGYIRLSFGRYPDSGGHGSLCRVFPPAYFSKYFKRLMGLSFKTYTDRGKDLGGQGHALGGKNGDGSSRASAIRLPFFLLPRFPPDCGILSPSALSELAKDKI